MTLRTLVLLLPCAALFAAEKLPPSKIDPVPTPPASAPPANIDHDKTVGHLNIGHVSSSVATLLNVERPMLNFAPVITADDSGIKSVVEEAKNVA